MDPDDIELNDCLDHTEDREDERNGSSGGQVDLVAVPIAKNQVAGYRPRLRDLAIHN